MQTSLFHFGRCELSYQDIRVTPSTGTSAISVSYAPGYAFWLDGVTCHFSAAPTTSENFTVTLNASDGAAYDTVLYSIDPSAYSAADIEFRPEGGPRSCKAGDSIDVAYTNTDGRTYGVRIEARLM